MAIHEQSLINRRSIEPRSINIQAILICLLLLALAGCAVSPRYSMPLNSSSAPLDFSPTPIASKYDPKWIQEFDVSLMKKEAELLASYRGSIDSKIDLFGDIECIRRVNIAKARAANALMSSEKLTRREAMTKVQADPQWFIAEERCK